MNLPREIVQHLFHLVQSQPAAFGLIGAVDGVARACFPLAAHRGMTMVDLVQEMEAQGLKPFATFAVSGELPLIPERPEGLALPALPHLMIGQRTQGVLEIDAYLEGPSGWTSVELRLPKDHP